MCQDWASTSRCSAAWSCAEGSGWHLEPTHCSHGHELRSWENFGWPRACRGHGGGGHTLWHRRASPDTDAPTLRAAVEHPLFGPDRPDQERTSFNGTSEPPLTMRGSTLARINFEGRHQLKEKPRRRALGAL